MKQLLIIPHRLPGMNDIAWKNNWRFQKLKVNMEESIAAEIRKQRLKPMPFAYLSFIWFEHTTKRDPDNICAGVKFINDALVNCKILPGDGWAHVLGLKHQFVRDTKSCVHVTLTTEDA